MPELPEVETIRRVLEKWILNKKIKQVKLIYNPIFNIANEEELNKKLENQVFENIKRYGKFLVLETNDYSIVSHLRMEGKYYLGHYKGNKHFVEGKEYEPSNLNSFSKHVHLIFEFNDESILMYHDVRKFGRFSIYNKGEYLKDKGLSKLGPEPFDIDNVDPLFLKLKKSTRPIKSMILDQSFLAGIGNIYADETLFKAKIDPRLESRLINKQQLSAIVEASKEVLLKATDAGGSTIKSYHFGDGIDGRFQHSLFVYAREGKECFICKTPIVKMNVGQRGTHFCPNCQRKPFDKDVKVVGITGIIGSGKTTVAKMLEEEGFIILDADKYSKEALKKDTSTYKEVVKYFGDKILDENNNINRATLRDVVVNDNNKLKKLESFIHPYVILRTKEEITKQKGKYLLDVPLLFEAKMNALCDATLYVHTMDKIRKDRLLKRGGMTLKEAEGLKENALTANEKMFLSDFVIDNSFSYQTTKKQLELLQKFLWKK